MNSRIFREIGKSAGQSQDGSRSVLTNLFLETWLDLASLCCDYQSWRQSVAKSGVLLIANHRTPLLPSLTLVLKSNKLLCRGPLLGFLTKRTVQGAHNSSKENL